ncbi:extracellular solute-binding protein [Caviibacter abscessus]|uniref:extracellular solute-binding protein n=1 Tax=Caviibacter abscessus TaxID=1766719 RepID=UPI000A81955A|nr:extracellular solute-binding protein [Caviibacter abscessus]
MKKFFLYLIMSILLLTSCGSSTTNENELNIYTWIYFIPDDVVEKFEKETGIKVNITYYDNNDTMMAKLLTGTDQYDIVSPSTDYVDVMIKNNMLLKLDKTKLKNTFENLDADRLKLYEFSKIYDNGLNYSIPYGYFATGVNVNTSILGKDFPRDLSLFENEKYKSGMTMLDDGRETLGLALQYLGFESNTSNDKELEAAKQLIIKFKKNLAKFDSTTFGKGLASGEFVVSHGYPDVFYETSEEEQKNFTYFLPKGAMMYIDNMSIPSNAKHVENAYKFLEFLYKPENYVKVFEQFRQIPVIKGVEKLTTVKSIVTVEEILKNAKLPVGLDEATREKQNKVWDEIKLAK